MDSNDGSRGNEQAGEKPRDLQMTERRPQAETTEKKLHKTDKKSRRRPKMPKLPKVPKFFGE